MNHIFYRSLFITIFMVWIPFSPAQTVKKNVKWQSVITVKDNAGNQQDLIFGQATEATDDIDASLGELLLPPYPPTGVFDSRFQLPVNYSESIIDYRNISQTGITWKIRTQPGSSTYNITYSWNKNSLPAGTFYLMDMFDGLVFKVDMKNTASYTNTNSALNPVKIVATGLTAVSEPANPAIRQISLQQNYPNPFNPATRITYTISHSDFVTVKVFSPLGKEVATLVSGVKPAGTYTAEFNAGSLTGGIYYYQLTANGSTLTKPCCLIK